MVFMTVHKGSIQMNMTDIQRIAPLYPETHHLAKLTDVLSKDWCIHYTNFWYIPITIKDSQQGILPLRDLDISLILEETLTITTWYSLGSIGHIYIYPGEIVDQAEATLLIYFRASSSDEASYIANLYIEKLNQCILRYKIPGVVRKIKDVVYVNTSEDVKIAGKDLHALFEDRGSLGDQYFEHLPDTPYIEVSN